MSAFKKTALGVAGVLVLGGLIFGGNMWSYLRTAGSEVRETVEDAVPIEFQLKRAKDMLENELGPEISRMKKVWAKSDVEAEELQTELVADAKNLATLREEMAYLAGELKTQRTTFTIKNTSFTRSEVEDNLTGRLKEAKSREATLNSKNELLTTKKGAAEQNKAKIARLLEAKENLELHIEELEARIEKVAAQETVEGSEFDESKLKRIEELLGDVEADVRVRERELDLDEAAGTPRIDVPTGDESPTGSIADEVNAYLNGGNVTGNVAETESVEAEPTN